jgi:hypothetical protein
MDLSELEHWWQRVQAASLEASDLTDLVGAPDVHREDYIECIPGRSRFARARVLGIRLHTIRWISGFELGFRSPEPLVWKPAKERLGAPERVVSQPPKWGAPLSFLFRSIRGSRTATMTITVAWFDSDLSKVDGDIAHVAAVTFVRLPGPTDLLERPALQGP